MRMYLTIICILLLACLSKAQEGWKLIDRFHGFRYEVSFPASSKAGFEEQVRKYADDLKCFGWVQTLTQPTNQKTASLTLVGEARCMKENGRKFQQWLETEVNTTPSAKLDLRVYEDTKIRLHFTYFKVLDPRRDTCFVDFPHKCGGRRTSRDSGGKEHAADEL